jgi:organic hydroperoxide reductase OsmC/OhrA
MSAARHEHFAMVMRRRGADEAYTEQRHSRVHQWRFDGGAPVAASSSPQVVPPPFLVPANVEPEEAFVAALSSCRRLFFLSFAAQQGFIVDHHEGSAIGAMGKDAQRKVVMLKLVLHPRARVGGARQAQAPELHALHHRAHDNCFLANSVKCVVSVEAAP